MSDYDENELDGPAPLREAHKRLQEEVKAERDRIAKLESQLRERDLKDELGKRGLDSRVAKLIPADAEVAAWLEENGELFGVKPTPESTTSVSTEVSEEEKELARQQQLDSSGLRNANEGDILQKVNAASPNELMEMIRAAQRQ